ncbi:ATP-dependent DNA helicase sgs1 [Puccinia graminis f. sp. tritici]|uniref:DNA 3'-5' helicase n=1 Tax=Puccinia graminis f. sp. tritici TaxID=56615 RepID=A0A5B0MDX2_PUCGR|nr:ATP-dependent DNA helicase sgs1 [Puccinia graminis f. sp. tritici]
MLRHLHTPAIRVPHRTSGRVQLLKKISEKKGQALKQAIGEIAQAAYRQLAKDLQIETVSNLARGDNTFLLAGTGFGKSRIPEIYHKLHRKDSNAVILVLNPLDALGDNQVLEKIQAGFTAINLTKLTFNADEANKIVNGDYNFVYLSPEIFLNSPLWDQVYFCANFQDRLALVVVDEAHIVYQWGLVESGSGKHKLSLLGCLEDLGIFRPSYGKLGARLLTRNAKPILLMSATCRPAAVTEIKKSLKLEDHNVKVVSGELTRPEIRIIRRPIMTSMASCEDLVDLFPPKSEVPDASVVPTLIYSGTRNRTLQVMKSLDLARRTRGNSTRPNSTFVRRFHSCTGEKDKIKVVQDFADGLFPEISCTMALGMGQNWSRVRCVVQLGRADPSAICQMIGRAGRDGRAGLAIIYVEPNRKGGKNSVEEFDPCGSQGDDDRMDALAVTPLMLACLLFRLGYIPLSVEDPNYILEQEREVRASFVECHCSNCKPEMGEGLMRNIKKMNIDNMDEMMETEWTVPADVELTTGSANHTKRKRVGAHTATLTGGKRIKLSVPLQKVLSETLMDAFQTVFDKKYPTGTLFLASDVFGKEEIDEIIKKFGKINGVAGLRKRIGGQMVAGQMEALHMAIEGFIAGPLANEAKEKLERQKIARLAKRQEADRGRAERRAIEEEAGQSQREEKARLRKEEEDRLAAKKVIEDKWKAEQAVHLALLVRLAGEEATRRGVASIHRGC